MSELVKQNTVGTLVKEADAKIETYKEVIDREAIKLSSITKIENADHNNELIKVLRDSEEPIKDLNDIELEIRRQLTAFGKNRQAKVDELVAPLVNQRERIKKLRTDFVLEEERKKKELLAKQEAERKIGEEVSRRLLEISRTLATNAANKRKEMVDAIEAKQTVEEINQYYGALKKPLNGNYKVGYEKLFANDSEEVKGKLMAIMNLYKFNEEVNKIALDNYEYILGLKDSFITAINDADARIKMQEEQQRIAKEQEEEAQRKAEEQAATLALEQAVTDQIQVQSLETNTKNVRRKMALNQAVASSDLPIATWQKLLDTFLFQGGDREKLLKLLIPVFNKANKDKQFVVLEGFEWKEDITVAS